ncbi:MAG: ATP phosphoribosyltransferase [Parvularculaceae bacterium]
MDQRKGRLRVAIQKKGRLADKSLDLFRRAGLRLSNGKNDLFFKAENFPADFLMVRDDDIPTFVNSGVCEFGIVGRNVLEEWCLGGDDRQIEVLKPTGFGKCSLRIAVPDGANYRGPQSLSGMRIATSYPRLLKAFLDANNVEAFIVRMSGAVELAPRLNIAAAICDLVSTGQTLEANGLKAADIVLESEALLVRSGGKFDPSLESVAEKLRLRFNGVLATEETKYVMLNAPAAALKKITEILPGAEAPTVVPLAGDADRYAVHAVCKESVFWETLERLKAAGASAILVLPIEKMML